MGAGVRPCATMRTSLPVLTAALALLTACAEAFPTVDEGDGGFGPARRDGALAPPVVYDPNDPDPPPSEKPPPSSDAGAVFQPRPPDPAGGDAGVPEPPPPPESMAGQVVVNLNCPLTTCVCADGQRVDVQLAVRLERGARCLRDAEACAAEVEGVAACDGHGGLPAPPENPPPNNPPPNDPPPNNPPPNDPPPDVNDDDPCRLEGNWLLELGPPENPRGACSGLPGLITADLEIVWADDFYLVSVAGGFPAFAFPNPLCIILFPVAGQVQGPSSVLDISGLVGIGPVGNQYIGGVGLTLTDQAGECQAQYPARMR